MNVSAIRDIGKIQKGIVNQRVMKNAKMASALHQMYALVIPDIKVMRRIHVIQNVSIAQQTVIVLDQIYVSAIKVLIIH